MDTLVQEPYDICSKSVCSDDENDYYSWVENSKTNGSTSDLQVKEPQPALLLLCEEGEGESLKEDDHHSDAVFKFIRDMLMEEEDELQNRASMLHECLALQATEKSFYDVLNNHNRDDFTKNYSTPSDWCLNEALSEFHVLPLDSSNEKKKNRVREPPIDEGNIVRRSNKQMAGSIDENEPLEMFDSVLLCSISEERRNHNFQRTKKKSPAIPRRGGKKNTINESGVDLRALLLQCAQCVSAFDMRTANELLLRIREHSSPHGDGAQRLAHYIANAIEARLAGTGTELYSAIDSRSLSAAEGLKAYEMFITACPFEKMSNLFASIAIRKLAAGATRLHLVDFGILYGLHWPSLIKALSEQPSGPPRLRITGIDFPQPGLRPAERLEGTGCRLASYCRRFGVPFEYKAIAQKWESVRVEDLEIGKDDLVVANCLYRLHHVGDETVGVGRDAVLELMRKMKPAMFVHGVACGTYNTPFFVSRFKETLYHFSSMFDMFEATVAREDEYRLLFEEMVLGKEVMNVIACEDTERIERPEGYRQWQCRTARAGFRQMELDQEIVKYVRDKVRRDYHEEFSVDEDGNWMLQGWKGRVTHAISCWEPANN
ncbi:Scarecrow-like protein 14 [Striga hermonthica]|uniref:Scarecrow-like protein 14 n=1 Tax=Striga hermonthica TaxID=68872 RepID=A0A9N7NWP0_STRHE|nr:Scarecrow-like protein 14 [Striga hermonthica]